MSPSLNFQKKVVFCQNWIGHVMLLEGQMQFSLSFSLKLQAEKTDLGYPKTFYGDISWYLLNIFATAAKK